MVATASLRRFFDRLPTRLVDALPDGVSVTFALTGPDGGSWTVERSHDGVGRVVLDEPARPDCRLQCTVPDFQALLNGDLDPRTGFLEGRLDVEGDVGLVLRLHRCLVA